MVGGMSQPGLGAMIHWLSGGTQEPASKYYGREIADASLSDDALAIHFTDGTRIRLTDKGQSCCENRYITSDDKAEELIGGKLVAIEVKDVAEKNGEYDDVHETCFVEVRTDKTTYTVVTHNEHNGYYGGFALDIAEEA
jgi:hypothetical protein